MGMVTVGEKLKRFPRRNHCARLLLPFPLEDAQCREIIFDLLKCIQGGLAVTGDGCVVIGERRLRSGSPPPAIENRLR